MKRLPNDTPEQQAIALSEDNLRLRAELDAAKDELEDAWKMADAKQQQLLESKANEARLQAALVHVAEYWNGSHSDEAMSDACEHIPMAANEALQGGSTALRELLEPTMELEERAGRGLVSGHITNKCLCDACVIARELAHDAARLRAVTEGGK